MTDLNKIRDFTFTTIIRDIESRQTRPLTLEEKTKVVNLIDEAMLAPVRNSGMIDDLADYVLEQLEKEETP